jgi:hypothetical protein
MECHDAPARVGIARAEQRIGVALDDDGQLVVLTPGAGFCEFAFDQGPTWLPFDVTDFVTVEADG